MKLRWWIVLILIAVPLGGALAGAADVWIPGLIEGTPLEARSGQSPLAWTAVAFGLEWAAVSWGND